MQIAIGIGIGIRRATPWWRAPGLRLDGSSPAAIIDFRAGRYALPALEVGDIPGASLAQLTALRPATFAECFAFSASSTTARTYVDAAGVLRNDLAADQPRFDWSTGRRRLLLEGAATTLARNSRFEDWTATFPAGYNATDASVVERVSGLFGGNALKIKGPSANGTSRRINTGFSGLVGNTTYTMSARLRKTRGTTARLHLAADTWSGNAFVLDLSDAPIGEWRIVSVTAMSTASPTGGGGLHTGDTDCDIEIDWWQLEAGSVRTSLIVNDTQSAMTRAIETARFSPLVEALFQRAAGTARVRYRLHREATYKQRILGAPGVIALIADDATRRVTAWNGSTVLTSIGTKLLTENTATVVAWDAVGRAICQEGAASPATDTNTLGSRSEVYLGRGGTVSSDVLYASGLYDSVTLWPVRGANASLAPLAVAT